MARAPWLYDDLDRLANRLAGQLKKEARRIIGSNAASVAVRDRFNTLADDLIVAVSLKYGPLPDRSAVWRVRLVDIVRRAHVLLGDDDQAVDPMTFEKRKGM